ncbi:MAG: branched-chain amino acid ABC transporter permease [Alphaproteobacteria bacterium]|nr:branched-chain amino acid ABC transporter permease [Alphaproteobacteria bacterium]
MYIIQTAFNGVISGVIMTLPALAVTLLFGVLKFPNFAVGAMMTVAAYLAFALNAQLGWPLLAAALTAALAMGVLCIAIDQVTFKPLRERGGITLMVASLGLGFILENLARFAYGNAARSFVIELARPFRVADIRMNYEQMITLSVSATAMLLMWFLLSRTATGRAMRAVADNPALALVRGIESPRVIRWTWFITGLLLGVGGVLIGMDRALEPPMGSNYLISVFAAAILGGLGSPLGAFVGAIIIGVVSELSTLVLPPNYRIGVPLVAIALVLIFRPQGLFGQPYIRK